MRHFTDDWIKEWCEDNGWTDWFMERLNHYWAFPPGAVMPEPIPREVMYIIKMEKGFCSEEKRWIYMALVLTALSIVFTVCTRSPMPLVLAFAFDTVASLRLEVEL